MIRYNIRITHGDNEFVKTYYFVHKKWNTISKEDSDKAFNDAVQELNHIYKTYGRFATETGILRLFDSF